MQIFAPQTILRLAWRHTRRRPLQSLFFVIGVAIGVAMIIAIDLANGSASRAFALGAESVTGRATHQIVGGPSGLDEAVYVALRRELGYRRSAPVVERYVLTQELDAQPMRLLGIDPFAEAPFRSYLGAGDQRQGVAPDFLAALMVRPDSALLSSDVADRFGLAVGDVLTVQVDTESRTLEIAGLLAPADDLSRRALEGLIITDIATAQEVLGRIGKIDRIDLIVDEGEAGQADLVRIQSALPPDARVEIAAAKQSAVGEMTAAFQLNLTALSLLALVVGVFLIYNTVTFSVVQRRPVLGSLRALGMTRREIFAIILAEAGVLGVIGTLIGVALGIVLGRSAVQMVTQTINDLFFVVAVRTVDIPLFTLAKGAVIGVAAALFGALIPAIEATSVTPAGAFKRSDMEDRARRLLPWVTGAAVLLLIIGAILLVPEWNLVVSFTGLFAVILGCAFLTPLAMLLLMRGAQSAIADRTGVIARMAPRTVIRALSRTSVAAAALMVSVSVIIGVGVMTGSFRNTVELWLEDILQADIYISPPNLSSNQVAAVLDPTIAAQMEAFPGIAKVATSRGVDIAAFLDGSETATTVRVVALSDDLAGAGRRYRESSGDWRETWDQVMAGGVIINEPMSNRHDLGVGDSLLLQTDRGLHTFPIVGVTMDFDVQNVAFMHDPVYRRFWDDEAISAIGVFVDESGNRDAGEANVGEADVDEKVREIRAAYAGKAELLVRSNRGTRENALAIFDRTFAITVALQLLATIVAFVGILSTLMSLQFERRREIGALRSAGMTRRQLWRLSLLETGLIGGSAGLLAMPTGLLLAVVLIYIINLRSFGWTLQMQLEPRQFIEAFAVALLAALLAGIYPAWRMGRMQPADAVRNE